MGDRSLRAFRLTILLSAVFLLVAAQTTALQLPGAPSREEEPLYSPPAWKSVEVGNYYLKRNRLPAALSRFQEAVKTDPYYAEGYLGLGKVYDKIGLRQKALANYQKYLDLLPSTKDALEAKEVHKAIDRLQRGLRSRKRAKDTKPAAPARAQPQE